MAVEVKPLKVSYVMLSLLSKPSNIVASFEGDSSCVLPLYHQYFDIVGSSGPFYRKPLPPLFFGDIRFSTQIVGKNTLKLTMKRICESGGFHGYFTNHSGKVTCASQLFEAQMDEQLIMTRTGHRSSDGVRSYKLTAPSLEKHVSSTLDPPTKRKTLDGKENHIPTTTTVTRVEASEPSPPEENKPAKAVEQLLSGGSTLTNCTFNFS